MPAVSSEAVGAYKAHVEQLARKQARYSSAEFDDLVQEGLIMVWMSLAKGIAPGTQQIEGRMIDWIRWLKRQNSLPYELYLPMEIPEYDWEPEEPAYI